MLGWSQQAYLEGITDHRVIGLSRCLAGRMTERAQSFTPTRARLGEYSVILIFHGVALECIQELRTLK